MYVIPQHAIVRDPYDFSILPPEGKEVPDNRYWRRRLRQGDIKLGQPPKPPKNKKGEATDE
jgi:hypothetical protein